MSDDDPGYAVSSLDQIGEGYGFRKIRHAVGVTAFGINAVVLPPGYSSGEHYHEQQEETYFVHQGELEFRRDVYSYDALAWALYKNGRYSEAQDYIQKALVLKTPEPMFHQHAEAISQALERAAK